MIAPFPAAAASDTNVRLKTNTNEINKTKKITIEAVKKPVAPTAPVVKTTKKNVVVNKETTATKTPVVKTVTKPTVKTAKAPQKPVSTHKANVTKPTKAANPTQATKPKEIAKPVNNTVTSSVIPASAINVWEENARQKCLSWGVKFENTGFSEIPQSGDTTKAVEKIFSANNNAYISADFNGDGKKDYVIITPDGGCKTGGNNYYGKIGPPNQFLLSNDRGYSIASGFNAWTSPQQIKHSGNSDIIELNTPYTGKCGQVSKTTWGWDGEKITIIERRNQQGQLVNQEGCLLLIPTSVNALQMGNSIKKADFPPITPGFYTYSVTCSNAISESRRDRPSKFIGLFSPNVWGYFYDDGIAWNNIRLEDLDMVSDNQYRLHLRYQGSANSAELTEANMKILGNDRFSITLKNYTTTYSLCPDASIPDWLRAQFAN
jgi:hypothetical protein